MKSVFDVSVLDELTNRIHTLSPDAERSWGKMNSAQMLAHCSAALKMGVGDVKLSHLFIGKLIGKFIKKKLMDEGPFRKNSPTAKSFIISDDRNFKKEKETLIALLKRFHENGANNTPSDPHPFFGKMTAMEWDRLTYKHLDHHLRQFSV
jgi:Protein of unknown function (DUF1569)